MSSPRKRKNEEVSSNDEEEPVIKSAKSFAAEFRSKLQGSDPLEALKQLLKDEKEENIDEYIRQGGNLSELLAILNKFDVKKNIAQALPVFQAITIFIIKCMSNFPEKQKELVEECRQLLSIHLSLCHTMLTSIYSPKQKKVALKLLTALISCDQELAWQILTYLKLTHQDIEALAFARKQTDPTSVREHFIRFLMAFLIDQPVELVRKFITQKGLLVSIFSGLKSDSYRDVIMVLTTLKTTIVDNKNINKTQKLAIFNTASICHLVGTYSWDPNADESQPINADIRNEVRQCLHELLLVLLTSVKMGVVFNDPSIGTSFREFNELAATVINGFGKPWGDEMREDLFVKMLSACPDIVKPAYRQIDSFLSTMDSPKWIQGLDFFNKLINQMELDFSSLPVKARTNLIKSVFAPPFLLTKLVQSLQSTHVSCRSAALSCLCTCLKKLNSLEEFYTKSVMDNYLISNISCAENLIENIQSFCTAGLINEENSMKGLISALDCLLYSYKICPQLLDSLRFKHKYQVLLKDSLNLIKSKLKSDKSCEENNSSKMIVDSQSEELQSEIDTKLASLKLIELLLIIWPLDSSQENFEFWLEDLSDCISPHKDIVEESLVLIKHILGSTGYFTGRQGQKELEIWIYCLSNNLSVDSVKLIVESVKYGGINTKALYTDLIAAENIMTEEERSTPTSTLDLRDYIAAAKHIGETEASNNGNVYSLSVPFLSMLKILHEDKTFKNCQSFVVSVVVHLLHLQANCEMFVAVLKLYNKCIPASALKYTESWCRSSGLPLLLPPFKQESVFHLTSEYLLGKSCDLPDISELSDYELELLISQVLFCSVRGCGAKVSSNLVRLIVMKCSKLVPFALDYQPLVDSFQPRKSIDGPSNSTLLVMTLFEFLKDKCESIKLYQHRLCLELTCGLPKTESLKECVSYIGQILDTVKLTKTSIKRLLGTCFPLPKMAQLDGGDWRIVQEYLLREGVRFNCKFNLENIIVFLRQMAPTLSTYSTEIDLKFLDAMGAYLEYHYPLTNWNMSMNETLTALLEEVIKCEVWSETLALYLYKHTDVDLSEASLNKVASLMHLVSLKLKPSRIAKLLVLHKSEIISIIRNPESFAWLEKISTAVHPLKFGKSSLLLKPICIDIMKKRSKINVCVPNIKLIHTLFIQANEPQDLFFLINEYFLQPEYIEDEALGKCLTSALEEILEISACSISGDLTKTLLASGLKQPYPHLIKALKLAIKKDCCELSAKEIFSLLTSHSQFLNTLIGKQTDIKYEVLELLEVLLSKDSSLIKAAHLPVYFSAYNATLSLHDQVLVKIIKMYEKSGVDLCKFKPYIWGEAAAQKYSVRQQRKRIDEDESSCPTIQLIDIDMVHNTIKYFPAGRLCNSEVTEVTKGDEIYDVEFLLGALSQTVGPGCPMYPSQIPSTGVTALAYLSLGSKCPTIRAAGYLIIYRYYTSLTKRKDDQLWSHLVEKLQRTVCGSENAQLSGILSVFLARASLIMAEPYHPLFKSIHKFVLVKPVFDLHGIPGFLEFFHSSDSVNAKSLHTWILEIVRDGLRNQDDFQIVLSTLSLKLLLDFYCCKLACPKTQAIIEEILERCMECDKTRQLLVYEYSLLSWLSFVKKFKVALDTVPSAQRFNAIREYFVQKYREIYSEQLDVAEEEKVI